MRYFYIFLTFFLIKNHCAGQAEELYFTSLSYRVIFRIEIFLWESLVLGIKNFLELNFPVVDLLI